MLGSPELAWLVDRIRGRLERGEPIDGTVTLVGAMPTQRRAAARLLGRNVGRGTSLSVPLPAVAAELWRAAAAPNLVPAVEALGGPVRNLAAERATDLKRWADALAEVRASWLSQYAWYREWLDAISRDGTVTRLIRQGQANVIGQAVAVLERLPNGPEPSTAVLASPASREAEQALWSAAGVVADNLASQVLVFNLKSGGEPVGRWLSEAAEAGLPFRLTLRQIMAAPVLPWALEIFVCSSTALIADADQLGPAGPALVCTEGQPSVACTRLLESAASSGSAVRWHADFSWPGLRGTATAIRRLRAEPWLMAATDYQAALAAGADPLRGKAEPSPWDPRLAELMRMTGRAVLEERVLPGLLAELAARTEPQLPVSGR